MPDFSKPETKAIYEREVRKRVEEFGMSLEQAQMLVATLMVELDSQVSENSQQMEN